MGYDHKGIEKNLVDEMASIGISMHRKLGGNNGSYMLNENSYKTKGHNDANDIMKVYRNIIKIGTSFANRYKVIGENSDKLDGYKDGSLSCIGIVNEAKDWVSRFDKFYYNGSLTDVMVENFFKHSYNLGVELLAILDRV